MPPAPDSHEVEAKLLAASPAPLRKLARAASLGRFRLQKRGTARLRTLYLDTAQHTLEGNGVALRLRCRGRHWELTAKWSGSVDGAVHARREINEPLRAAPRLPFQLPSDSAIATELTALVLGRPLHVQVVTVIRRQIFDLVDAGGEVAAELALDTVRHGRDEDNLQAPYCEVEVEQRGATLADLRDLSRLLQSQYGLQPSLDTKWQRAVKAVHRGSPAAHRNEPIGDDDTWETAARKIAAAQLARLRAGDAQIRRGDGDPEAVHLTRVATRRLRALLRLFATAIPKQLRDASLLDLGWLGDALGAARDLDVRLAELSGAGADATPVVTSYRAHLDATRAGARASLNAVLGSQRYTRLLLRLERFATGHPRRHLGAPAASLHTAAAAEIRSEYDRLRRKTKRVLKDPRAAALHKLRIRYRRLRYLLEFLTPVLDPRAASLIARLTAFQDLLGEANDRIGLARELRAHAAENGAAAAAAETADNLLLEAGRMHEHFRRSWRGSRSTMDKQVAAVVKGLRRHGDANKAARARRPRLTATTKAAPRRREQSGARVPTAVDCHDKS